MRDSCLVFVEFRRSRSKARSPERARKMVGVPECPFAKLPMSPVDDRERMHQCRRVTHRERPAPGGVIDPRWQAIIAISEFIEEEPEVLVVRGSLGRIHG
jgi:hypothetical protein